MNLTSYIQLLDIENDPVQQEWYERFTKGVRKGQSLFKNATPKKQASFKSMFDLWVQTEELKAWYGEPENGSLFQGTSISSLTIPYELKNPLIINSIEDLEEAISNAYIESHDRYEKNVIDANLENVDTWISEGLYFGVTLGSKMISQAFNLTAPAESVVFDVQGVTVDPHEITTYPEDIRSAYFDMCRNQIDCFRNINLNQTDFEKSLVLSDISKPKIERYKGKIMLGSVFNNEIAAVLSSRVTTLIKEKTSGRISPRSLMVCIYDTDTPYTYHQVAGYFGEQMAPILPGLTLLGSSGSCEAFKWLYIYRCSLIAQKIMKGSLYSEYARKFMPFVFFGVLVERDADILLDLNRLSLLRYRGDISPYLEFCYLLPKLDKQFSESSKKPLETEISERIC
jgi:hypothetical protein